MKRIFIRALNAAAPILKSAALACLLTHSITGYTQESDTPDTTGVWYHIRHNQIQLANEEYNRLKAEFSDWVPAQDLVDAMSRLNAPPMPGNIPHKTPAPTVEQNQAASQAPQVKPAVVDKDTQLAARIAKQSQTERATLSEDSLQRLLAYTEKQSTADLHVLSGWVLLAKSQFSQAIASFEQSKRLTQHADLIAQANDGVTAALSQWVEFAANNKQINTLTHLLSTFATQNVPAQIDAAAWTAFNQADYLYARQLFTLTGNSYGTVLSFEKAGETATAFELACQHQAIAALQDYCVNKLAEQQLVHYNRNDFNASLATAQQMAEIRPLSNDALILKGWAYYRLEASQNAIASFDELLSRAPDNREYQQALFTAINQTNDLTLYNSTVSKYPSLLPYIARQSRQLAEARNQFDLGYLHVPEETVEDRGNVTVYAGLFSGNRSGASGLSKFHQLNHYIAISDLVSHWRLTARFDYEQLYSGHPAQGAWFGNDTYNREQYFHSGIEDTGVSLSAARQFDNFSFYADIRYLLMDQPVDSSVTGQFGGTWFSDRTTLSGMLYTLRKTDSLLSTAGAAAQDGQPWGGVIATGARSLWVQTLSPRWSTALNLDYAQLDGERTQDNHYWAAAISLNADIKGYVDYPLDYFRVGPRLSYFTYDENQSLFTVSHGGYFSPQDYWSISAFAQLLTVEGAHWQIKLDANIGYSRVNEDGTYRLLFEQPPEEYLDKTSTQGISGNLLLEGQWQFAAHWSLAGFVKQSNAVRYRSTQFGLQIRWQPGRLNGLTSDWLINNSPWHSGFAL